MIKRSLGCLVVLAAFFLVATWPLGKLLFDMAVAMVKVADGNRQMFDTTPGVVIEATKADPKKIFPRNVRVEYRYEDQEYVGFTRMTPLSRLNDTLEVGDSVTVYVCRQDPEIIKLVITDSSECPRPAVEPPEGLAD